MNTNGFVVTWAEWLELKAAQRRRDKIDHPEFGAPLEDAEQLPEVASPMYGEDEEFVHPALNNLRDGTILTDVDVIAQWRDDHVDCFSLSLTFGEDKYVMALWYTDPVILLEFGKAINNVERGKKLAEQLVPMQ